MREVATTSVFSAPDTSSTWSDPVTDVTEEARFLGVHGARVLAFLHRPTSRTALGGVVICGSVYEDFGVNYRRELLVARELARRGFAVVRFHYRGFGNSDALPSGAVTFESMVADATTATSWLRTHIAANALAYCGSRLGALVAAHLVLHVKGAPLVVWAPLATGADFFRGMSRASLLAGVRAEAKKRQASSSPLQRLDEQENVEMLGNRVRRASYEDLGPRTLPGDLGPRPVLLVQLGIGESLTASNQELASGWRAYGAHVDVQLVPTRQLWSVPERWEPEDSRPETPLIVTGIPGWIDAAMRGTA